jgi:hypothetical protein
LLPWEEKEDDDKDGANGFCEGVESLGGGVVVELGMPESAEIEPVDLALLIGGKTTDAFGDKTDDDDDDEGSAAIDLVGTLVDDEDDEEEEAAAAAALAACRCCFLDKGAGGGTGGASNTVTRDGTDVGTADWDTEEVVEEDDDDLAIGISAGLISGSRAAFSATFEVEPFTAARGGFELAIVKTCLEVPVDATGADVVVLVVLLLLAAAAAVEDEPDEEEELNIRRLTESSLTVAVISSTLEFRDRDVGVETAEETAEDGKPIANKGVNSLFFFFLDDAGGCGTVDEELSFSFKGVAESYLASLELLLLTKGAVEAVSFSDTSGGVGLFGSGIVDELVMVSFVELLTNRGAGGG